MKGGTMRRLCGWKLLDFDTIFWASLRRSSFASVAYISKSLHFEQNILQTPVLSYHIVLHLLFDQTGSDFIPSIPQLQRTLPLLDLGQIEYPFLVRAVKRPIGLAIVPMLVDCLPDPRCFLVDFLQSLVYLNKRLIFLFLSHAIRTPVYITTYLPWFPQPFLCGFAPASAIIKLLILCGLSYRQQKWVSFWFTAQDDQTAAAFFSLILFWRSMILALTASFSFLISSSLASFSFCFLSSIRKRLLFYVDSFSHRQIVSAAMFILVTPFISSSLQEFRVLAELSKLELNSGNFLVRKQRDSLLSKFFFSRALYSLLSSVAFSTYTSKTFNLSVSSSFYFLTQSSFSSAFFLKSTSMPLSFPFRPSIFSFNSAFSLSKASLSFQNSVIFDLISSRDFSRSSQIFCLFLTSSQTLSLTVFWMLRIVFLIQSMPLQILCFSSMRFSASRLNFSLSDFIFS